MDISRIPCSAWLICVILLFRPCVHLTAAVTLSFDGSQYLTISLNNETVTQVGDVSLRFKTDRENGLLFSTTSSTTDDKLMVSLDGGSVRLDINLGGLRQTMNEGQGLNDDAWHNVHVRRRNKRLVLKVDDGANIKARLHSAEDHSLSFDEIQVGKKPTSSPPSASSQPENFVGHMQHFIYNNNNFFEMAFRTGNVKNIDTNAKFDQDNDMVEFPITFKTPSAYLVTRQEFPGMFSIFLRVKTTQPDGLILYSGSTRANDFLALEVFNGRIRCVIDVGNGPHVLESTLATSVSDNKWHDVSVIKIGLHQMVLRVDESSTLDNMAETRTTQLDTDGKVYLGGATPQVFTYLPSQVKSRMGYQGCLGSVNLDEEETHSLLDSASDLPEEFTEKIKEGCEGPVEECKPDSCENHGVCVQHWNSISCNCDLTSYTGNTCTEVSTAYQFRPGGGRIQFQLPAAQHRDTKVDELALGFITKQKDAVLARINSADSKDYIEMELIGGNILVVYNMGTTSHPIGDMFADVNDGKYHVVRFRRSGPNATVQIDDRLPQTKFPTGHQLSVFNNQSDVSIGGKKDILGKLLRQFEGTIAGFVLNGYKVLDLAAKGDPRVQIEGDVGLNSSFQLPTTASLTPTPMSSVSSTPITSTPAGPLSPPDTVSTMPTKNNSDSIIQSGSGCGEVTDENCNTPPDNSSIIVPAIKITKSKPQTTTTSPKPSRPDDKDNPTTAEPEMTAEASGEGAENPECDDADNDGCDTGSTGIDDNPAVTDDIGFGTSEEETTATQSIVITLNMTEVPLKEEEASTVLPKVGGPGGPGGGGSKNINPSIVESDNSKESHTPLSINIGLIVGIAAGVILLLFILGYAVYKYRSRDEGTYKVDETKNYRYETVSTKPPNHQQNGNSTLTKPVTNGSKPKKKGPVKEWYV